MEDQTVSQGSSDGSPGTAPSSEDERIKGFQRALSAKDQAFQEAQGRAADLQRQLEEMRLAAMSDTDRSAFLSTREQSRYRDLELQNERLKLALKYPELSPHYEALLEAPTAEAQVLYLKNLLNPPTSSPDVSDVDPNNPMRQPNDPIGQPPSLVMDEAQADRILALHGSRPYRS